MWTDSSRVLTINRMSLYPQTFEAIMFLKYNRKWWGIEEVKEAMTMVSNLSGRKSKYIRDAEEEDEKEKRNRHGRRRAR